MTSETRTATAEGVRDDRVLAATRWASLAVFLILDMGAKRGQMRPMALRYRALVGIVSAALLTVGLFAPQGASASAPASRSACDGVRLLAAPYVVIGIGAITIDVSGPLNDLVLCQAVDLPRIGGAPASAEHCDDAQVPGASLRPRLAAEAVRCLIDKERTSRGLSRLDPQKSLKKAAKRHTGQMLAAGCFSHLCPGEPDLVGRVTAAGYLPCACTWSVGENLAWGTGETSSPAGIVAAWMASPPHREMILTGSMRDVDVGVRAGEPGNPDAATAATYTADFGYRD